MGNPESGRDLESVANLVRLSETAPMPRIDGSEPPPLVPPRAGRAEATLSAFGGVLDESTGSPAEQLAARGPLPAAAVAALPTEAAPATETGPPVQRRPARYGVYAGAVVVLCAGLGAWGLWPSSGGTDAPPPVAPPAQTHRPDAPPAVSTLSASPTPPAMTGQLRDTPVRPTSRPAPQRTQPAPAPQGGNQEQGPGDDPFGAAVSSYLQQWSEQGYPPPRYGHG